MPSRLYERLAPPQWSSLLSTPSTTITTFWPPPPPTDTHDKLCPFAETVAGTSRAPGSIVINAIMLRLIIGSCVTSVCRIDDETTAWVDSTRGDWPLTVIV